MVIYMPINLRWSSLLYISWLFAQLPARYGVKGDALSFLWREYRAWGEYRLFQWAPPFISSVDRHRWDGMTAILGMSYFRRLPLRGGIMRVGLRYYPQKPAYSPQGLWVGLHLAAGLWNARRERPLLAFAPGLTIGYQYIFGQAYGALVEPYVMIEPYLRRGFPFRPVQVGINVGFASRRWDRRMLP